MSYHFILSEGARLIGHEVANAAEFLRNCGTAGNGFWDCFILLNHKRICCLAHI